MLVDRVRIGSKKGSKYIGELYLAQDDDFVKVNNRWVYRGSELEIEIPHIIQGEKVTSYAYMFYGTGNYLATPVTRVDSNNKRVTNMSYMFRDSMATTLDLSSFDTSNVTNTSQMFYNSKATTLDLSSFDTSNVIQMNSMFHRSSATTLDLSSFDTFNVTSMNYMFYNSSATTLDLSSFDTSNVTDMSYMFRDSMATTLDLSSFDTSNVANMSQMFYNSKATTLDLSSFDTANITDMSHMFNSSKATTLDLSSFNTSNVTNMNAMFNASQATTLDLGSFDTANVTDMSHMFNGSKATTLDLSSFDTSNVTNMVDMFRSSKATTGYARTQADADRFNASSNKPAGLTFIVKPDDLSGSPGSLNLIAGNMEAGYFGEVSASELITGNDLALSVGISEGKSQNSTGGWLKFAYKNKVQFVAKKTFRMEISWNSINSANCVFGGAVIEIGGLSYKVRLLRTVTNDPSSNNSTNHHYNEWNKLMLPIHIKAKDRSWQYPNNVENDLEYWGIDFTDVDLNTGEAGGSGQGSWCQESSTTDSGRAHMRGYIRGDASEANTIAKTSVSIATGWRPVLELIE